MLPAIFWLIIGFVVGVLFNERLVKQRHESAARPSTPPVERPALRRQPPPSDPTPPAKEHVKFEPQETPVPPPAVHPPAAPESASDPAADSRADDLTAIKGIGATFSQRLKEAGITTFAKLAATDADHLREITRIRDWQKPAPEEWIAEAQSLA